MGPGYDLPPLIFTSDEIEALVLGLRMVEAWSDPSLARSAADVAAKVKAVLPGALGQHMQATALFVPQCHIPNGSNAAFATVRTAIFSQHRLTFEYVRADGNSLPREVRPLGLFFWGKKWTLVAWCELRNDFRSFRLDRMTKLQATRRRFVGEPGTNLEDFFRYVKQVSGSKNKSVHM
jgi:predicted DNA-binding transcriptional regulator YafY